MTTNLPELHFIEAHSALGQRVDPEPIIRGIQAANMPTIEVSDIATHKIGLFVTEGISPGLPAVGYVACKGTFRTGDRPPNGIEQVALIGSLFLLPRYRGIGLGHLLVNEVTNRTFNQYPGTEECIANCNELSSSAFEAVGYIPSDTLPSGKVEYFLQRSNWKNISYR